MWNSSCTWTMTAIFTYRGCFQHWRRGEYSEKGFGRLGYVPAFGGLNRATKRKRKHREVSDTRYWWSEQF